MFEGDVVRSAALWGHVLWVCDGHGEDSAEAGVAHPMTAGEFGGSGYGGLGEAGQTLHPAEFVSNL